MITLKHAAENVAPVLSVAAMVLCGSTGLALAQSPTPTPPCKPAQVIPLTGPEPAAKLVVDAPLAAPLASRGVVVIPYCAENMRIAPVFGPGALTVSPRVGHIHVTVDATPWHWADASGTPIILRGMPPGPHKVLIELVDANHQPVDKGTVAFEVPEKVAAGAPSALAPCAVELIKGSMIFSCSMIEPGHPCVTISGSAFSCFDRT